MTSILSLEKESGLVSFFLSFNIPKVQAIALSRSIVHWTRHHGIAFAVSRLKDLKQQRIHFENGSTQTFVKSHSDLTPCGSFRCLWKSSVNLEDSLTMLNVYTCEKSPSITLQQAKKFVDSVNYEGPWVEDVNLSIDGLVKYSLNSFKHKTRNYGSALNWIRKVDKRAPSFTDGKIKTVPETSLDLDTFISEFRDASEANRRLLMEYKDIFSSSMYSGSSQLSLFTSKVLQRTGEFPPGDVLFKNLKAPPLVGKIGQIQEKGLKLRSVANPFRILQHALYPLGTYLYGVLEQLPSDCTFDQDEGFKFIRSKLSDGHTMYAFDLSNATDRFPLSIQVNLVKQLISSLPSFGSASAEHPTVGTTNSIKPEDLLRQVDLLSAISRGRWFAPELEFYSNSKFLVWKTGQPLGLYPSFALFAMAHNALLLNIESICGVKNSFRVLGDDVIISDEQVACHYKKALDAYGCKISEDKSIVSDRFGEFAGKLTFPDKTLNIPKWQHFSKENPFGPLNVLGDKGLTFVPKRHQEDVMFLASLPQPYGLEINPLGLSLDERVVPFHEILMKKQHELEPVTDYEQSSTDKTSSVKDFWERVVVGKTTTAKWSNPIWGKPELPREPDQGARCVENIDILKIEHFNTYISSLSNWEVPTIEQPQSNRTVDRTLWKKPTHSLYKLKRMFRRSN